MLPNLRACLKSLILAINQRFFALRCSHTGVYAALRCSKITAFCLKLKNFKQALRTLRSCDINSQQTLFSIAILAGGLATRLRPLTESFPKALIDIHGKPFLWHQLQLLKKNGFKNVVICVGYLGEKIQSVIGDGSEFGLSIQYVYDSEDASHLLGTGGALKKALPYLTENFFVLYGDSYLPCDYAAVQAAFLQKQRLGLMTIFHNHGEGDKSNVYYVSDEIVCYNKQAVDPQFEYIDYGLGVFHRSAWDEVSADKIYDLAELYQNLLHQKQLASLEVKERFYEIGSFRGIEEIKTFLKK